MKYTMFFATIVLLLSCNNSKNKEANPSSESTAEVATTNSIILIDNPSEENSQLPRLFSDGNELYFSWVTRKDSTDYLSYSVFTNNTWQTPKLITQGKNWFTNWADFPAIAANKGSVLTNHLQKSADGTYTYDVRLNLFEKNLPNPSSDQEGVQYTKRNFILHNDGTKSEHGFVSMIPYQENSFFVTWLDGRHTTGGHGSGGPMTLRSAVIPATGEVAQRTELDSKVCDCCQTSAAMTSIGPIVAYRDRSDEEIRDISIVRYLDGAWTSPKTIGDDNWKIAGCPVNGPSIDAKGNNVAVAWFTAHTGEGDVQVVFSEDAGKTFTEAFKIDSGNATGRVDIELLNNKEAAVLWMQPQDEKEILYVMKVNIHGITSQPVVVSETSSDRASGFPQMERLGDNLIFAWTASSKEQAVIKTATLSLDALVMPENIP